MRFGYARVSKNDQSLDVQVQKLKLAGCDEIYMEKVSGVKEERKELKRLMERLRKGDTVCVVRLDRLGRRMLKLVEMINEFKEKNINFISLENNIDTTTTLGMVLFSMCAAFSEMERELICERIKAGLDSARGKGRTGGRPKALTFEKEKMLRALYHSNSMSVKQICNAVGITRSVYYRAVSIL